ncbi:hypothetical protein AB0B50_20065 [Streptomyces sp. NPDC041068]|uniref:aromatic-ring hydroxylase C-terminal domain-containing protein n=1 Tax=Streptomyces sp. NPDC041068 TaxID=3155130 RepID=UPI00340EB943
MSAFTPENLDLRSLLSEMVADQPEFNRALSERLTGLGVTYPPAEATAHPLTGTRAPDLAFTDSANSLFTVLRTDAHVLLVPAAGDGLSGLERPGVAVRSGTLHRPPAAWAQVSAALIRPDGHVLWASTERDAGALAAAALQALVGAP